MNPVNPVHARFRSVAEHQHHSLQYSRPVSQQALGPNRPNRPRTAPVTRVESIICCPNPSAFKLSWFCCACPHSIPTIVCISTKCCAWQQHGINIMYRLLYILRIIVICRGTDSDSYKMTRRKTKRHTVTEMWTIEYLLPYKTKLQHSVDQPWHGPGLKVVPVVIQVENFDCVWRGMLALFMVETGQNAWKWGWHYGGK